MLVILEAYSPNACCRLNTLFIGTFGEIRLRAMPQNPLDEKPNAVHILAWWSQVSSHYIRQCWPSVMSPYGVYRPGRYRWVNWCGLIMMHGEINLRQHCLRQWSVDWRHHVITEWDLVQLQKEFEIIQIHIQNMFSASHQTWYNIQHNHIDRHKSRGWIVMVSGLRLDV